MLHRCDNPSCVRPSHLFLGTHADNATDAKSKGRLRSGERHQNSKLTWAKVEEIRALYATGEWKQRDLARRYGMSQGPIADIVTGKAWIRA